MIFNGAWGEEREKTERKQQARTRGRKKAMVRNGGSWAKRRQLGDWGVLPWSPEF